MKFLPQLLIALCMCAGLATWQRALSRSATGQQDGALIARLIEADELAGKPVAAVSVTSARTGEWLFVRSKGQWRAATSFSAPVRADMLAALVSSLTDARAVLRTSDAGRQAPYGFVDSQLFTLRLHGSALMKATDRDVLCAFDLGDSIAAGPHGRAFVRRVGGSDVYEIDHDPRRLLEWHGADGGSASQLPALIDDRIIGSAWPQGLRDFERIFVDAADDAMELSWHWDDAAGQRQQTWTATVAGEQHALDPERVVSYFTYLLRARYKSVADPRRASEFGIDAQATQLTIFPSEREPAEIEVGRALASPDLAQSVSFVLNRTSRVLGQMDATRAALLIPTLAALTGATSADPWLPYLAESGAH